MTLLIEWIYLSVPLIAKKLAPTSRGVDIFLILFLWLPVEFGLLTAWFLPLLAAADLVIIYQYLWPIRTPWRLGWAVPKPADIGLALIAVVILSFFLLPLGYGLTFFHWSPRGLPWSTVTIIFFLALIEEILFRGVVQNLFELWTGRAGLSLIVVAILFGLSHLNNVSPTAGIPNLRYAGLATAAGLGYGWVWWRSRNVWVSAVTHAVVNILWKAALSGTA